MKYEVEINANDSITPHTIFAVNGPMVARAVTLAEADFIVRACNSHEQLVEALRRLIAAKEACAVIFAASSEEAEYGEAMDAARAALAAAEAA